MIAYVLALAIQAPVDMGTADAGAPVETASARVVRLRAELRAAELAEMAERVNRAVRRKRGTR